MARLGFEARITVRALHPNRFDMCSPAPWKRVFHEPLEAEDNQPHAERRDGCCAKCEGDHHADHMNLPAYSWRTLPHRAGAWSWVQAQRIDPPGGGATGARFGRGEYPSSVCFPYKTFKH